MAVLTVGVDATALVERPTGVGNYIAPLLELLCTRSPDSRFLLYSNQPVHFQRFGNVRARVSQPKRRGPYWQNTQLRRMLTEDRPDVFWATNGLMPTWRPSGVATVVTVHDLVYRFAPGTLPWHSRWGRRLFQPLAVKMADRVIAVSQTTAADIAACYRRRADAVIYPLPHRRYRRPDQNLARATAARLGLPDRYLLVLGTLEPRKNLSAFINAYLDRLDAGTALPLLAIAGGKGWLDEDIDRKLTQGECRGAIRRLGYVDADDLPHLYANCEAFVMPSIYEGFGMPLLEAQRCGAPVIHGDHSSMIEAAEGLGTQTGTSFGAMCQMLDAYARGELPLACRLPAADNREQAAERLWALLHEAASVRRNMTAR